MTEERAALDPIEEIGRLISKIDELEKSLSSRVVRRPTGDFEITLRKTPKADTIFLQGQTLQRADYPSLWQWAQDQDLVFAGFFTAGNGSTTFSIPDLRGRFIIGTGDLSPDSYAHGVKAGSSTKVILPVNMAAHTHQVSIANHSISVGSDDNSHQHGFGTGVDGPSHQHGTHYHNIVSGVINHSGGTGTHVTNPIGGNTGNATNAHTHSGTTGNANVAHQHYSSISNHSVAQVVVGSNTPLDIRPPYVALNYMMWT